MNRLIKVNFHSAVDVITNSSTTIFTYSAGCDKKAIELINEFLKVLGSDLKAEDMFYMGVFCTDLYYYLEVQCNHYWKDGKVDRELMEEDGCDADFIDAMVNDDYSVTKDIEAVLFGEKEKPQWMKNAETDTWYGEGYNGPTSLYILPKDEKYTVIAKKIVEFLYSTETEATYG